MIRKYHKNSILLSSKLISKKKKTWTSGKVDYFCFTSVTPDGMDF
jgi:hypothetical protein